MLSIYMHMIRRMTRDGAIARSRERSEVWGARRSGVMDLESLT